MGRPADALAGSLLRGGIALRSGKRYHAFAAIVSEVGHGLTLYAERPDPRGILDLARDMISMLGIEFLDGEGFGFDGAVRQGRCNQVFTGLGAGDEQIGAIGLFVDRRTIDHDPGIGAGDIRLLTDGVRANLASELDIIGPGTSVLYQTLS